ncbi:hypothetical protein [Amycolatopsis pigmentata]|uniref:PRC-barrel domain-containing protein n=1 Tax=Amycolatopsis pigmentata TaxID=450801 RepID=A0ABW5FWN7_9PSEU
MTGDQAGPDESPHRIFAETVTANDMLWDRQIYDADGEEVGKVDDLELTMPGDGGSPFVSALLCGPAALGPRLGRPVGRWWAAAGHRPLRIPMELVERLDRHEVRLRVPARELPDPRRGNRLWDRIVSRIPGSGR